MKLTDNPEKQHALDLAEDSRQEAWHHPSFVAELFKGNFRWDLIHPYPTQNDADKKIGDAVLEKLEKVLKETIDPEQVDQTRELPKSAIQALAKEGFFGMKIPKEYGGMGLSITNYLRAMELVGSWCGSTAVWLSAHQSIGVPQPLKMFGTKAQKETYLPRLAAGAISAFALTEPDVGSDPAKMATKATLSDDKTHYLLNGDKLYITNGPAAELLVVMAITEPKIVNGKEKKQITAFIVETNSPGFEVMHRCDFMGIRGIQNGLLRFKNVKVPVENIIGEPGQGLKIALATLNTGRLTIPAISAGAGKLCVHFSQQWAKKRVQWGLPIGEHQNVTVRLADMVANTFAMESVSFLTAALAENEKTDIRIEAAIAKYFTSEVSWKVVDDALQIRGGRGYEKASSLKSRGEEAYPLERMMRDLRINRIIEGTSDIMQLFIAREAMDTHVKYLMALTSPKLSFTQKLGVVAKAGWFYLTWYPRLYVPSIQFYKTRHLNHHNQLHLKYINRTTKKLARRLFHTMLRYQQKLEKEQVILGHFVDIGTGLFAMAASLAKAESILKNHPNAKAIQHSVDLFCKSERKRIARHFHDACCSPTKLATKVGHDVLASEFEWMMGDVIRTA